MLEEGGDGGDSVSRLELLSACASEGIHATAGIFAHGTTFGRMLEAVLREDDDATAHWRTANCRVVTVLDRR